MTEQTVPEPTAFGAVVMDIALERGFGDPANLQIRDELHKVLDDHMNGVKKKRHNSRRYRDLAYRVALAFGMDPHDPATVQDTVDCMRLAMAYTFSEKFLDGLR